MDKSESVRITSEIFGNLSDEAKAIVAGDLNEQHRGEVWRNQVMIAVKHGIESRDAFEAHVYPYEVQACEERRKKGVENVIKRDRKGNPKLDDAGNYIYNTSYCTATSSWRSNKSLIGQALDKGILLTESGEVKVRDLLQAQIKASDILSPEEMEGMSVADLKSTSRRDLTPEEWVKEHYPKLIRKLKDCNFDTVIEVFDAVSEIHSERLVKGE